FRQIDVLPAGEQVFQIPFALAVTDEHKKAVVHHSVLQSQHIEHVVESRLLAADPERGLERAAREDHAVGRLVGEFEALISACENHAVVASDIPAAQRSKADAARVARAGMAITSAFGVVLKADLAACGGRLAEQ